MVAGSSMFKRLAFFVGAVIITIAIFKALPHGPQGIYEWSKEKGQQTERIVKDKTGNLSLDGVKAPKLLPTQTPAPSKAKN